MRRQPKHDIQNLKSIMRDALTQHLFQQMDEIVTERINRICRKQRDIYLQKGESITPAFYYWGKAYYHLPVSTFPVTYNLDPSLHSEMDEVLELKQGVTSSSRNAIENMIIAALNISELPRHLMQLLPETFHEPIESWNRGDTHYPLLEQSVVEQYKKTYANVFELVDEQAMFNMIMG